MTYYSENPKAGSPNVLLNVSWYNMLKCVKVEYNEKSDRFEVNTLFTKDMGHIFVSGMMIIKNTYHTI